MPQKCDGREMPGRLNDGKGVIRNAILDYRFGAIIFFIMPMFGST